MNRIFGMVHTRNDRYDLYHNNKVILSLSRDEFLELKDLLDIAYEDTCDVDEAEKEEMEW